MLTEDSVRTPTRAPIARTGGKTVARRGFRTRRRFLVAGLIIVAAIGYMIYAAIEGGSEYYMTTSELKAMGDKAAGQQIKLGGRVVDNSIQWDRGANTVAFSVTDEKQTLLPVSYKGVVPDTFQPGADIIVEGKLGADGKFQANSMLAKCASKYEPANR